MSLDESLRKLERQAAATEDVEVVASRIRAGLRAGSKTEAVIRLAALSGHEASCLLFPEVVRAPSILDWTLGMSQGDWRCALVCARVAYELLASMSGLWRQAHSGDERVSVALSAIGNWIDCPCEPHAGAATSLSSHGSPADLAGQEAYEIVMPEPRHDLWFAEATVSLGSAIGFTQRVWVDQYGDRRAIADVARATGHLLSDMSERFPECAGPMWAIVAREAGVLALS